MVFDKFIKGIGITGFIVASVSALFLLAIFPAVADGIISLFVTASGPLISESNITTFALGALVIFVVGYGFVLFSAKQEGKN